MTFADVFEGNLPPLGLAIGGVQVGDADADGADGFSGYESADEGIKG